MDLTHLIHAVPHKRHRLAPSRALSVHGRIPLAPHRGTRHRCNRSSHPHSPKPLLPLCLHTTTSNAKSAAETNAALSLHSGRQFITTFASPYVAVPST